MKRRLFCLPLVLVGLDQLTKWAVLVNLEPYVLVPLLPFFALTNVANRGAAFSFLASFEHANYLFIVVAFVAIIGIGYWLYCHGSKEPKLNQYALLCIMGGAAGNLLDRLNHGYVVDFIVLHYRNWYYPSFNVADSAISLGVVLLFYTMFTEWFKPQSAPPSC